jgi:heme-degrading monooxygenase HmoA
MVRATLYVTIKAGREDEFVQVWREISQKVRGASGNLRQALLRDPDDPRSFVVMSDWESREAFTRFERSPEQDELTAPVRDLRETGRMTVHDLLIDVEGGRTE